MAYKGKFKPKNPHKYIGDPTNIIYRSRWECVFMSYLDSQPNVINWGSEEIIIPYKSPIDGKMHRYFPDFLVKKKNKEGKIDTQIIEIKPLKQTKPPSIQTKATKTYINEVKEWGINSSKWEAAQKYCNSRGWQFLILTEKELKINF